MQINVLDRNNSVINNYLAELRDINTQTDRMRFRRNLQRIGSLMAYEVSRTLSYEPRAVVSPLATAQVQLPTDEVVIGTILRAGLPMHEGVLDIFDHADNCFVSAFRKYSSEKDFDIELEYVATPSLEGKTLLLCDPMLATGSSLALTYEKLLCFGKPKHTHLMSIFGAQPGVDYVLQKLDNQNITVWLATLDPMLNAHKYIVPGLGDAGDLAFGEKM